MDVKKKPQIKRSVLKYDHPKSISSHKELKKKEVLNMEKRRITRKERREQLARFQLAGESYKVIHYIDGD